MCVYSRNFCGCGAVHFEETSNKVEVKTGGERQSRLLKTEENFRLMPVFDNDWSRATRRYAYFPSLCFPHSSPRLFHVAVADPACLISESPLADLSLVRIVAE